MRRCSSPAATMSNSLGSASVRDARQHLGWHAADSDAGHGDAGAAQDARGQVIVSPAIEPIWTNRVRVVVRRRVAGAPARRAPARPVRPTGSRAPRRRAARRACSATRSRSGPRRRGRWRRRRRRCAASPGGRCRGPATTTRPAPNTDLASWTAIEPVTPVAPSTSTWSPGLIAARVLQGHPGRQPGLGTAAAVTESTSSGSSTAPCWADQRALGHHAVGRQRAGVDPAAVVEAGDPVDAGDRRVV